ncbi:Ferroporti-1 [Apiospora phragmitis]|uniref:Solute carrier family 40 member n=1 Tax=Apiospora phragmitis TaxID=2905665 RepID=A0ABR1VGH8_9PEZI
MANEQSPLLGIEEASDDGAQTQRRQQGEIPPSIVRALYVSHTLSAWNSRLFEFGAVLYLATIFPGTLLPMSIYAITRGLAAIVFAPAMGQYIDSGDRLQVVRVSIAGQRLAVALSCGIFGFLVKRGPLESQGKAGLLALLAFLACVEKLCSTLNLISVEKDWVVVIADNDEAVLRSLNAQMRRIDLLCKLLGPLFIALLVGISTEFAIWVNLGMSLMSVVFEYFAIARVYHEVDGLQIPKNGPQLSRPDGPNNADRAENCALPHWSRVQAMFSKSVADFRLYFCHCALLPSMACALLYLTVLSFGGQMVTFLLGSGYDSTRVGAARTLSVVFEVLATWVAPWLMSSVGPVRAGLWFSTVHITMLVTGMTVFMAYRDDDPVIAASGMVGGTVLSRVGLRGFDLCTQIIVQEEVEADIRGTFSSVEAAMQNAFELLSYALTIMFFRPQQFMIPALASVGAVTAASCCYTLFVYIRRGHILHPEKLAGACGCWPGKERQRERLLDHINSERDI